MIMLRDELSGYKKPGYWYIRYVDDDDSWNEWVGPDRIRLRKKE